MRINIVPGLTCILLLISCSHAKETSSEPENEGFTPVTVTHPVTGELSETITLNAYSRFLLKTSIKSDINGYIQKVMVQPGQRVRLGEELFALRSKESEHLGNTVNSLDTAFHFGGLVSVKSPSDGYVTDVLFKTGDYVQENEVIASVSDRNSLVFLLELPYELINIIPQNKNPELNLPDGTILKGTIQSSLPAVDPVSQTLSCIIRVKEGASVPENLAASVKFTVRSKKDATILPIESLLTDDAQKDFWIMKMADSSIAVKVPVKTGLVTSDKVEITSPVLLPSDIILLTGNYGLPDTAKVIIESVK
jgi:multidrug efflux pump subunit AcrA (membrane-fusion protein)